VAAKYSLECFSHAKNPKLFPFPSHDEISFLSDFATPIHIHAKRTYFFSTFSRLLLHERARKFGIEFEGYSTTLTRFVQEKVSQNLFEWIIFWHDFHVFF